MSSRNHYFFYGANISFENLLCDGPKTMGCYDVKSSKDLARMIIAVLRLNNLTDSWNETMTTSIFYFC